jgi:Rha family phage regulatory protein
MAELMNATQTLSSMEVAEMVEKEHHKLLRDIRRYTKQFNESNLGLVENKEGKISPIDFWSESSYQDSKGEQRPCHQITKLGCEFIAHKTTGAKGTAFTAKYIVRFHQMEEALKQANIVQYLPLQSNTPVPLNPRRGFYWEWKREIDAICKALDWSYKGLYHHILSYIGKTYDIDAAREIYKKELGHYPEHAMDIIDYFPKLKSYAIDILSWLESFVRPEDYPDYEE